MGRLWDKIRFSRFGGVANECARLFWDRARKIDATDNQELYHLLRYILKRGSNAIDIGAYRGEVLRRLIAHAPEGQQHAFEPVPELAEDLRKRFPQANIHQCALSDQQGTSSFHHVKGWACISSLNEERTRREAGTARTIETIDVRVERLDDEIPSNQKIDFIKIDTEGVTLNVIRGARRIIERDRPPLVFEYMSADDKGSDTSPRDYYDLVVRDLGYTLFTVAGIGPLSLEAFADEVARGDTWNFLARDY